MLVDGERTDQTLGVRMQLGVEFGQTLALFGERLGVRAQDHGPEIVGKAGEIFLHLLELQ